jgi:hypothetical protein
MEVEKKMIKHSLFTPFRRIMEIRPKPLIIALFIWLGIIIILLGIKLPLWLYLITTYIGNFLFIWAGCSIYGHAELPTINEPITGKLAKVIGILIIFSGLYALIGYKIVEFIYGIK